TATATTEIYPLSLHDALPIYEDLCRIRVKPEKAEAGTGNGAAEHHQLSRTGHITDTQVTGKLHMTTEVGNNAERRGYQHTRQDRSEEHTSELQSRENLVCRLL